MEKTNVMVEFCIIGDDFNLDSVTTELRLNSSEQYLKGERNHRGKCMTETFWSVSTGYKESLFVSELLEEILDLFIGKEQTLIGLREKYNLTFKFFVVIKVEDNIKPSIYLDSRVIRFANEIQAEFDFDLYVMS